MLEPCLFLYSETEGHCYLCHSTALYFLLSYMDTEQYEEAVRDYEKVYQTEKTKGKGIWEHASQETVWPYLSALRTGHG